mgnify:CR=1 FL=1
MQAAIVILAALVGLAVGSFLNVCIDRLPAGVSIITGRSRCDACKRQIRTRDLVPVLSYVALQGRCRDCHARIPARVLLVELVTALGFAGLALTRGPSATAAALAAYFAILVVVFVIDLERGLILNRVIYPAIVFAFLVSVLIRPAWLGVCFPHEALSAVIGAAGGFALLFLIALLSRGGMGWGDVKYAAFMGAATGFPLVFVALFCGVIIGAAIAILMLLAGKRGRKQAIPFGPFLAIGTMLTLLWGPAMLAWYTGLM